MMTHWTHCLKDTSPPYQRRSAQKPECRKGVCLAIGKAVSSRNWTDWKDELDELKNQPIDKPLIFNSAKNKAMSLLQREARVADLLTKPLKPLDDEGKGKREGKKGEGQKRFEKDKDRIRETVPKAKYEKKYELVKDYLIPVVQFMKVESKTHTEAFQLVDKNLGVPRGCASSQCTRTLRFFPGRKFSHARVC